MMNTRELREKMKECLLNEEIFTTSQLKERLNEKGWVYQVDYTLNTFSNGISSLVRQNYIVSIDDDRKGVYRVVKSGEDTKTLDGEVGIADMNDEKKKETYKSKSQDNEENVKNEWNNEDELKEMRDKIQEYLKVECCAKIRQMLDSKKPSIFTTNRKTYNNILELIDYLEGFKFDVEQ